jgi:hypothetical protein
MDLNPGRGKRFFSSPNRADWLCGPPSILFSGYQGSFLGLKRPGREVNHLPESSAKVKKEWSYTSAPAICLRGVHREDFTQHNNPETLRNINVVETSNLTVFTSASTCI